MIDLLLQNFLLMRTGRCGSFLIQRSTCRCPEIWCDKSNFPIGKEMTVAPAVVRKSGGFSYKKIPSTTRESVLCFSLKKGDKYLFALDCDVAKQ